LQLNYEWGWFFTRVTSSVPDMKSCFIETMFHNAEMSFVHWFGCAPAVALFNHPSPGKCIRCLSDGQSPDLKTFYHCWSTAGFNLVSTRLIFNHGTHDHPPIDRS